MTLNDLEWLNKIFKDTQQLSFLCLSLLASRDRPFGRIPWHVIPEPRITLQGAATWWIHCHGSRATCHIAGCNKSIRHIENRFSPFFIYFFVFFKCSLGFDERRLSYRLRYTYFSLHKRMKCDTVLRRHCHGNRSELCCIILTVFCRDRTKLVLRLCSFYSNLIQSNLISPFI